MQNVFVSLKDNLGRQKSKQFLPPKQYLLFLLFSCCFGQIWAEFYRIWAEFWSEIWAENCSRICSDFVQNLFRIKVFTQHLFRNCSELVQNLGGGVGQSSETLSRMWKEFGKSAKSIWSEVGNEFGKNLFRILVRVWKECGQKLERIWKEFQEFGKNFERIWEESLVRIWKESGKNLVRIWKISGKNWKEIMFHVLLGTMSRKGKGNKKQ